MVLAERHNAGRVSAFRVERRDDVTLRDVDIADIAPANSDWLGLLLSEAEVRAFALGAPVLFSLAFHGGRRRILDLEPVGHAAVAAGRTEAFRDDTFAPKRAGVPQDDFPVAVEMLVEGDAIIRAAEEVDQRVLTILEARPSDIRAIEFDEVEGA
jgi:hypothetical protein